MIKTYAHHCEQLLREGLVGRQVVVQEGDEPVARPLNVGNDVINGPGPESHAVHISR